MKKLTLERFENERQAGVKCVNLLCEFCMEKLEIVCDATDSSGDPSYANCLNYLPEKLIQGERSHTAAVASRIMEMVIPVTKKSITIAECDSLRIRIAAALQESGNNRSTKLACKEGELCIHWPVCKLDKYCGGKFYRTS